MTFTKKQLRTKDLTALAVFAAVAFVAMALIKIPVVQWLSYEPKDIILAIASFIYGPVAGFFAIVAVSVVEAITVSQTGPIGLVMNIIASGTFCVTASFIYSRRRTLSGAIIGLAAGAALTVAAMLLWNWLVTPIYMSTPELPIPAARNMVADMLLPVFLPFNVIKVTINATATILLYKPVVTALRKARLLPPASNGKGKKLWPVVITMIGAALLFAAAVVLIITKPF